MMNQKMELSVSSCGSAAERWKEKPNTSIINKVILRDKGDYALILKQDASKPIRYLYLTLLMSKNGVQNVKKMIAKLQNMKSRVTHLDFENMSEKMEKIGANIPSLLKQLNVLRKKLQGFQGDPLGILKISQQYDIVDPLLILSLRTIAHSRELKIRNASDCESALSLKQIEEIMESFGFQKFSSSQFLNKFVMITDLTQIECQFFKIQGINIETEASNFQELSDPFFLNYEEHIMIQKMFSLL